MSTKERNLGPLEQILVKHYKPEGFDMINLGRFDSFSYIVDTIRALDYCIDRKIREVEERQDLLKRFEYLNTFKGVKNLVPLNDMINYLWLKSIKNKSLLDKEHVSGSELCELYEISKKYELNAENFNSIAKFGMMQDEDRYYRFKEGLKKYGSIIFDSSSIFKNRYKLFLLKSATKYQESFDRYKSKMDRLIKKDEVVVSDYKLSDFEQDLKEYNLEKYREDFKFRDTNPEIAKVKMSFTKNMLDIGHFSYEEFRSIVKLIDETTDNLLQGDILQGINNHFDVKMDKKFLIQSTIKGIKAGKRYRNQKSYFDMIEDYKESLNRGYSDRISKFLAPVTKGKLDPRFYIAIAQIDGDIEARKGFIKYFDIFKNGLNFSNPKHSRLYNIVMIGSFLFKNRVTSKGVYNILNTPSEYLKRYSEGAVKSMLVHHKPISK